MQWAQPWLQDIETWFIVGLSIIGSMILFTIGLAVWAARRRRRAPPEAPAGTRQALPEAFVIVTLGSLAALPAWGMPLVWSSPGAVPIEMLVVAASADIISAVLLGWGGVKSVRAIRESGGRLGGWGWGTIVMPWIHAPLIGAMILGELIR